MYEDRRNNNLGTLYAARDECANTALTCPSDQVMSTPYGRYVLHVLVRTDTMIHL
jgi:hypothetical protein